MKQALTLLVATMIASTAFSATGPVINSNRSEPAGVKIQLIRNATMKLTYGGKTFLTDPMLSQKGEIRSFAGIASNPTVELPVSSADILSGIDAVLVSHLHPDHYHRASEQAVLLPKPLFCQPADAAAISKDGFGQVIPVDSTVEWEKITITRVGGKHGSDAILEKMGAVSGFVFQAPNLPTVYWAGDTVWCDEVAATIKSFKPQIIITHSGGATIPGFAPILMNAQQTIKTALSSPESTIVAIHLEALDHCTVGQKELQTAATAAGIDPARLVIPQDGETVTLAAGEFSAPAK
ncbi:MAG TPA: MBL fold metallo-hydrolase [Candidatus Rifleibacterium sp.]|nr:MBL fold metallo-hydrolase [Candidatus Rifleibacterium sp.]